MRLDGETRSNGVATFAPGRVKTRQNPGPVLEWETGGEDKKFLPGGHLSVGLLEQNTTGANICKAGVAVLSVGGEWCGRSFVVCEGKMRMSARD